MRGFITSRPGEISPISLVYDAFPARVWPLSVFYIRVLEDLLTFSSFFFLELSGELIVDPVMLFIAKQQTKIL